MKLKYHQEIITFQALKDRFINNKIAINFILLLCLFLNPLKLIAEEIAVKTTTTVRDNEPLTPSELKTEESKDRLTDNGNGLFSKLATKGVEIEAVYKGEVSSNRTGGIRQRTVYLGNFDFKTNINAETLMGWKGASVFFYVLADHGKDPTANVGDAQGTSNIETHVDTVKLYEAWIQQTFLDEKASLLVGLHDLNSEFYVTETSSLFLNSSFGVGKEFSQTGQNGPSIFPTTSLALRVRTEPAKSFYLQTGIFNGVAGDPEKARGTHVKWGGDSGLLIVSEMAFIRGKEEKSENKYSKYGVGIWNYTKTFEHISKTISIDPADPTATAPVQVNNNGFYFLAEQNIIEALTVFARYGIANSEVNRFRSNLSYGFVVTGLIPSRSSDRLGLAATTATNGSEYKEKNITDLTPVKNSETAIEVSYKIELKKGFAIQPDFQWVINPNTNPLLKNAAVAITRIEISI